MEQPRFMDLPITWIIDKDDEKTKERNELLNIESKTTKERGRIYINPQHIVAYNMSRLEDCCTLRLDDGEMYTILLSIKEFEQRLHDFCSPVSTYCVSHKG